MKRRRDRNTSKNSDRQVANGIGQITYQIQIMQIRPDVVNGRLVDHGSYTETALFMDAAAQKPMNLHK
jgi:hypothetical protein